MSGIHDTSRVPDVPLTQQQQHAPPEPPVNMHPKHATPCKEISMNRIYNLLNHENRLVLDATEECAQGNLELWELELRLERKKHEHDAGMNEYEASGKLHQDQAKELSDLLIAMSKGSENVFTVMYRQIVHVEAHRNSRPSKVNERLSSGVRETIGDLRDYRNRLENANIALERGDYIYRVLDAIENNCKPSESLWKRINQSGAFLILVKCLPETFFFVHNLSSAQKFGVRNQISKKYVIRFCMLFVFFFSSPVSIS